ncbi:MAG: hypothetical protein JW778_07510, partial [Candidatus Altiarchaeota archaeon]|nr:hypothetical protein [Candidatus Altiarchaeota archaeon]
TFNLHKQTHKQTCLTIREYRRLQSADIYFMSPFTISASNSRRDACCTSWICEADPFFFWGDEAC